MRLAHRPDRLGLPLGPPIGHQRRQPPDDVEEVPGQCRERLPATLGAVLGSPTDQCGEDRQQRHRQDDDEGAHPVEEHDRHHDEDRQDHRPDHGREESGDIGLDARDPLCRKGARGGGRRHTVDGSGEPPGQEALTQGSRHSYAGPRGIRLVEGSQRGADREDGREREEGGEQAGGTRHTEANDGDHDGRDGEGLGDGGDAECHAQRPEARHDAAGLGEGLEDPGVDRSHGLMLGEPRGGHPLVTCRR
ncbi:MAG: hypothetical protein BWY91_01475 [bacterium ADurb.BinA028]|nr:MAG: hypothetical protein BWY91_01475 [bacterium ADurb.BinA028]